MSYHTINSFVHFCIHIQQPFGVDDRIITVYRMLCNILILIVFKNEYRIYNFQC